ncbi:MAG: 3-methyl-2-oxobutanoate hydroxymethyltransferase [Dokdonella sp.]|jgi:3-methyl-2-oxobutanoate hydroxymethyltransferase|uniref:3-methyl-2-oxobutanoate hydroxymethyltransferase n=1 Tax=Dokdonella sp. TaxID=2291710 RepID=UPI002B8E837D|nr:3-methyl-2-oxobutanoate hydroxymethyltransferase [Dokdonella sp.]HOX70380.1 3-methyl-2-oxobutanoate hydroxymethyltransferase [Dokdonella sp.]HPG94531.1 3-methyl-2-oxobutanoate hydroxymethyltransferase [Dokdonella sp.]HPN80650.1 3-methyl-2-oxobutanoate hydroxymethyltransferase [Dokdonella sp.]
MYTDSASSPARPAITVPSLRQRKKGGEKIAALTCYDASFATRLDAAGIDVALVGDSLGMVVQGMSSTLPVTLDHMVYHCAAVARGMRTPLLIADLPFMSYRDVPTAMASAARLMAEGSAAMVKLEGAGWVVEVIAALAERDIPVCAHLGLTPQSVHKLGGYRVQGKLEADAARLLNDAKAIAAAGADLLVLECVPAELARRITAEIPIPTIGIGAGVDCDGQVLVLYDMLGITPGRRPRFSKDFLSGRGSIDAALLAYVEAVRRAEFPGPEHIY